MPPVLLTAVAITGAAIPPVANAAMAIAAILRRMVRSFRNDGLRTESNMSVAIDTRLLIDYRSMV